MKRYPNRASNSTTTAQLNEQIPSSWRIDSNYISVGDNELIGSGAFGVVRGVLFRDPKQFEVEVKAASKEITVFCTEKYVEKHEAFVARVCRELSLQMMVDSKFCVQGYGGYFESVERAHILMERMELGTLTEYLDENEDGLRNCMRVQLCLHCHDILEYLQRSLKIIHGDVSLNNLLVSAKGSVKLSDFGESRSLTGETDFLPVGSRTGRRVWQQRHYHLNRKAGTKVADLSVDQFSFCFVYLRILVGKCFLWEHAKSHKKIDFAAGLKVLGIRSYSFLLLLHDSIVNERVIDLLSLKQAIRDIDYGGKMQEYLNRTCHSAIKDDHMLGYFTRPEFNQSGIGFSNPRSDWSD